MRREQITAVSARPTRRQAGARRLGWRGFTLIEFILVIVITSVLAATLVVFMRPALESYLAVRSRADLVEQADAALRRMTRDVRVAVPNSIRIPSAQCFEVLPSSQGGRYRMEPDTVNDSGPDCSPGPSCSAALDTTQATSVFDVLTPLAPIPAVGDMVVVGNQAPEQVYGGSNRAAITALGTPDPRYGKHRLSIGNTQFPNGYDGGRLLIVPASQGPVFYVCAGADGSLDANGNGRGQLMRAMAYGYNATYPSVCPDTSNAHLLASQVLSCQFVYDPNQGATQQNGFVWLQIVLARRGEKITLAYGAHVDNAP
jgi:MSHA biogenesis protein MshO